MWKAVEGCCVEETWASARSTSRAPSAGSALPRRTRRGQGLLHEPCSAGRPRTCWGARLHLHGAAPPRQGRGDPLSADSGGTGGRGASPLDLLHLGRRCGCGRDTSWRARRCSRLSRALRRVGRRSAQVPDARQGGPPLVTLERRAADRQERLGTYDSPRAAGRLPGERSAGRPCAPPLGRADAFDLLLPCAAKGHPRGGGGPPNPRGCRLPLVRACAREAVVDPVLAVRACSP